ncbi:NAD(P)-dependent oxidoreductase [Oscillatoria amoena NRMC-F 0135]|nr:NAD(P)-dependent oxidoreductase [Oscillatoria amoena NRMC-F 0135]
MKIGLIGTGLMGQPMAMRLLAANQSVIVYNRTVAKLEPLKAAGAEIADSPLALIQAAECIILMLTDASAIQSVLLSSECWSALADRTIIQMGTIAPTDSRNLHTEIVAAGGNYLESPVLGSIPQVESGTLQVMVGSTPHEFQQWSGLLRHFGEPMYIGEVGTAAAVKLGLNQLIASLTSAFSLSLGFIQRQGGDVEKFMQILRESALYAPTFDKKLQRMLDRNYSNPNFPTKHLLKDTRLFLQEAETLQLNISALEGVREILEKAQQLGLADVDYSALFDAVSPREDS